MNTTITITCAVEGMVDEAVIRRLIEHINAIPGTFYGKKGKHNLLKNLKAYNAAARYAPWLVLIDLDQSEACAAALRQKHLPNPSTKLCFRVAVQKIEAWLLADRARIANFLKVPEPQIPDKPDLLGNPVQTMLNLSRKSKRAEIQKGMIPRPGSGRETGERYASLLVEFIQDTKSGWRPNVAADSSDSLRRCIRCLEQLARLRE